MAAPSTASLSGAAVPTQSVSGEVEDYFAVAAFGVNGSIYDGRRRIDAADWGVQRSTHNERQDVPNGGGGGSSRVWVAEKKAVNGHLFEDR